MSRSLCDEAPQRLAQVLAEPSLQLLARGKKWRGDLEVLRFVSRRRLAPALRERRQRMAGADQRTHLPHQARRLGPDSQQRVMRRADAPGPVQHQQPRVFESLEERGALRLALDEAAALEGSNDRQRLGCDRIGRDVDDECGDQRFQRLAAAVAQRLHRGVRSLGHRRRHALVIFRPQDAVAPRRLRLVEAFERHLQKRQRVAALRVSDEALAERRIAFAERERRLAGGDRARDDLLEFRRRWRGEVAGCAPGAKGEQRRAGLEARIGVGAQDHDHIADAARKGVQKRREGVGILRLGE